MNNGKWTLHNIAWSIEGQCPYFLQKLYLWQNFRRGPRSAHIHVKHAHGAGARKTGLHINSPPTGFEPRTPRSWCMLRITAHYTTQPPLNQTKSKRTTPTRMLKFVKVLTGKIPMKKYGDATSPKLECGCHYGGIKNGNTQNLYSHCRNRSDHRNSSVQ